MTNLEFQDIKKYLIIQDCKCGGRAKIKRYYTHIGFNGNSITDIKIYCKRCGQALHYYDSTDKITPQGIYRLVNKWNRGL